MLKGAPNSGRDIPTTIWHMLHMHVFKSKVTLLAGWLMACDRPFIVSEEEEEEDRGVKLTVFIMSA